MGGSFFEGLNFTNEQNLQNLHTAKKPTIQYMIVGLRSKLLGNTGSIPIV